MSSDSSDAAMPSLQPAQPVTLDSSVLFARGKEVRIRHAGEEYRLRLTSNNKLILTK